MKYPFEILPGLRSRWDQVGAQAQRTGSLPGDDVLRQLLDVAYQASFQVDEQRNTSVTLIFGAPSDFRAGPFVPVLFPAPRPFTAGEVSRLAPATDARQTMLCVGGDGLEIWGLLDVGTSWIEFALGERSDTARLPDLFTITVHQPGAFTLSRGGIILLRLRNGKESFPTGSVLEVGPVASRFATAAASAAIRITAALTEKGVPVRPQDLAASIYTRFVRRVLFRIRSKRHGGTVLVVPDGAGDAAAHHERVKIKYPLLHAGAWDDLFRFVASSRLHAELTHARADLDPARTAAAPAVRECELSRADAERKLAEHAAFIAGLAGVDGAVVLTDRYRILGFGAEVVVPSPGLEAIHIARDPAGRDTAPVSIETYGTRHRSAIRFCHSYEPAVAFVVSQDGEVRAIARVGDDVVMWPEINAGGMGL